MTKQKGGKTGLIITIVVLALTLGIVSWIAFTGRQSPQQQETITEQDNDTNNQQPEEVPTDQPEVVPPETESPTVNAEDFSSIAVEPLGVEVFYTKGLAGFEFEVKRTANSTQYAEFMSTELVGTKCTDDRGLFASIIKDPSSTEEATITLQTTVGDSDYGLSLASDACTADKKLLSSYQTAFKEGFSLLKAIDE
jgi:hypothetical protein